MSALRYSKDKKKLDYVQVADPIAVAFGFLNLDINDDIDDDQWTPTISLNWTPRGRPADLHKVQQRL